LDLGLVGVGTHDERVLVVIEQAVALLGDDGREQDVARVGQVGHADSSSVTGSGWTMLGTSLSMLCGARSSLEALALTDLPFAGPARKACSALSVKTTSSLTSTS